MGNVRLCDYTLFHSTVVVCAFLWWPQGGDTDLSKTSHTNPVLHGIKLSHPIESVVWGGATDRKSQISQSSWDEYKSVPLGISGKTWRHVNEHMEAFYWFSKWGEGHTVVSLTSRSMRCVKIFGSLTKLGDHSITHLTTC